MAFWGVYLKPNEPYTLQYDDDAFPKRLRITQATLGDATRNSPARSIVRCSIGDKPAIAICSLSVNELTCCQLDLEFEESHDVIFSVMGPRSVYLAGYLITQTPTDHKHSIDLNGQVKTTVEIAAHDLQEVEPDFSKTGPVKESTNAQYIDIENFGKNMEGGKHILNKSKQGKTFITVDPKFGKDEDQEKAVSLKTQSVGELLEEKSVNAIEKKKKRKKRKIKKLNASEATANEFGSDSKVTEQNCCSPERSHEKVKERKKKRKTSLDDDKNHMNGDTSKFNNRIEDGFSKKVKSREKVKRISKS